MALPKLTLPERLEPALLAGHPWVYREQVPAAFRAEHGSFVRLRCGRFDGFALWDRDSPLALRVYSRFQLPDRAWYLQRLQEAWGLRAPLLGRRTTAFRWVHGEADGLPGLVVDYYAGWAILVCDCSAVEPVASAIAELLPEVTTLSGVLLRKRHAAEGERLTLLSGVQPPETLTVEENGLFMRADLRVGQKTGLFLDHRENRAFLEGRAKGLRVLNLFGYSGAFLLYALRGGASHVVNVDSAAGAAQDARENLRLNGFDPAQHEFVVGDVFEYLERARQERTSFDLVICDPPSFARNQSHLDKALNAYSRVMGAALKVCVEGGTFAAASCTSRVTPPLFKQCLASAARRAQRRLQVVYESGQPLDHPELIGHPESRYLKFVLCRVLARP